jgi:SAM-dependent methyltransferase
MKHAASRGRVAYSGAIGGLHPRAFARRLRSDREFLDEFARRYPALKDEVLAEAMADPEIMERFRSGAELPPEFGLALDERLVEFPWVVAKAPSGDVLDAGSALNQRVALDRVLPLVRSLTITTFTPGAEEEHPGPRYVAADLRELPFDDESFDTVVSVSTLEHVGMDNSEYGSTEPRSEDPDKEMGRALDELRRVLRPGGRVLLTVPYGRNEDHGWLRQFNRRGLRRLLDRSGLRVDELIVYRHSLAGWQVSGLWRASLARYRNFHARPQPQRDCASAARAVACAELSLPSASGSSDQV